MIAALALVLLASRPACPESDGHRIEQREVKDGEVFVLSCRYCAEPPGRCRLAGSVEVRWLETAHPAAPPCSAMPEDAEEDAGRHARSADRRAWALATDHAPKDPLGGDHWLALAHDALARVEELALPCEDAPAPGVKLGVKAATGVVLVEVSPGSAAGRAGLEVGDAITHLDGATVSSAEDLVEQLAKVPAGATVTVRVLRAGSVLEKKVAF